MHRIVYATIYKLTKMENTTNKKRTNKAGLSEIKRKLDTDDNSPSERSSQQGQSPKKQKRQSLWSIAKSALSPEKHTKTPVFLIDRGVEKHRGFAGFFGDSADFGILQRVVFASSGISLWQAASLIGGAVVLGV